MMDTELRLIIIVFCGLLLAAVVAYIASKILEVRARRRRANKWRALEEEHKRTVQTILSRGALNPLPSAPIILKPGEVAYVAQKSDLYETRAVRHNSGSGASYRVARGAYIHSGGGKSVSSQEWQRIASGVLVITNKRLVFDGDSADRAVSLDKIIAITGRAEEVEISAENRQKSMVLTCDNGYTVEWIAKQILTAMQK